MKTGSIGNVRRAELSQAAFEAVLRYGLRKTTLDKVGEIAGVSKGVVLHHFKDKSVLLEAVFRRSNSLLSEAVIELYRYSHTPYERLWAIIFANFSDTTFHPRVCQAWVSLISEVQQSKQCQRVQVACNRRIESNFQHELKYFLNKAGAKRIALHLGLLIDGIWIRSGSTTTRLENAEVISELEWVLLKMLPRDSYNVDKHSEAKLKIESIASITLDSNAYRAKAL